MLACLSSYHKTPAFTVKGIAVLLVALRFLVLLGSKNHVGDTPGISGLSNTDVALRHLVGLVPRNIQTCTFPNRHFSDFHQACEEWRWCWQEFQYPK